MPTPLAGDSVAAVEVVEVAERARSLLHDDTELSAAVLGRGEEGGEEVVLKEVAQTREAGVVLHDHDADPVLPRGNEDAVPPPTSPPPFSEAEQAVAMAEDDRLPPWLHHAVDRVMKGNVKLVMLAGLPGSGKSTFAKLAQEKYGRAKHIIVLEQDELGCSKLEGSVGRAYKEATAHANGVLIIDRCNPTEQGRRELLEWCFNPRPKDVLCVHFATPQDVCAKRAWRRIDHPTIRFGSGEAALKHFILQMEPPGD